MVNVSLIRHQKTDNITQILISIHCSKFIKLTLGNEIFKEHFSPLVQGKSSIISKEPVIHKIFYPELLKP